MGDAFLFPFHRAPCNLGGVHSQLLEPLRGEQQQAEWNEQDKSERLLVVGPAVSPASAYPIPNLRSSTWGSNSNSSKPNSSRERVLVQLEKWERGSLQFVEGWRNSTSFSVFSFLSYCWQEVALGVGAAGNSLSIEEQLFKRLHVPHHRSRRPGDRGTQYFLSGDKNELWS